MKQSEFVQVNKPRSSVHDLSHEVKMTAKMANLTPVFIQEVLPTDKFRVTTEMLIRMQPLLFPLMHRINAYVHYFFVPNRIIWDEWESFITGGQMGTEMPNYPKITGTVQNFADHLDVNPGSLLDYMGLPVQNMVAGNTAEMEISQLPFRAYQRIFNEYYRDPNLMAEEAQLTGSEDYETSDNEATALTTMKKRCWEKDYFTSALPYAQRGEAVSIPIQEDAPVKLNASYSGAQKEQKWTRSDGQPSGTGDYPYLTDSQSSPIYTRAIDVAAQTTYLDPNSTLYADLSAATSASINDLRRSFALQRWLEKNMRGGYRYFEQLFSHFGVKSPDSRLQRPEYLGGGKIPVKISEVLQTSETNETAQGNMSGHGIAVGQTATFSKEFVEHGYIIGILSIMPRTAYQDGIPKHMQKFDRFEYYWPEFANIGEEPVKNSELYLSDSASTNEATFGYNPRYQDYRFSFDRVHGKMRTTLDAWHLGRKFTALPALNANFVQCNPSNRIWPITDGTYDDFIIQLYNDVKAIRPVVKWGTPI